MNKNDVRRFLRQYHIKQITSDVLLDIITQQGYTPIEFNGIADDEDVQTLIEALDLEQYVKSCRCFIYQNQNHRLIFINENLNEEERTIVLAHEEGHIWCRHINSGPVSIGADVIQEYEANQFMYLLLNDFSYPKRRFKKITAILILSLAIISSIICGVFTKYRKEVYTDDLYRTDNGQKYHHRECYYLKDHTDIHLLSNEEFESGLYEPCKVCFPDKW